MCVVIIPLHIVQCTMYRLFIYFINKGDDDDDDDFDDDDDG